MKIFELNNLEKEVIDDKFLTTFYTFSGSKKITITEKGTAFGFVTNGVVGIESCHKIYSCSKGMYFSMKAPFQLGDFGKGEASGFIAFRHDVEGFNNIGGPVEEEGRLKYIDGCTDSLLISPVKKGYPCLNLLYFPKGINQTMHTHPSVRAGVIYRGSGECNSGGKDIPLTEGYGWFIPTDCEHRFKTKDEPMTVIAYHPESDFGPEDENHPMINRTIVNGISAKDIHSIRTK